MKLLVLCLDCEGLTSAEAGEANCPRCGASGNLVYPTSPPTIVPEVASPAQVLLAYLGGLETERATLRKALEATYRQVVG